MGYIIGSRVAGVIFAGGVFSWLVVMPLIYFFGKELPHPVYPGQMPIAQMGPGDLWATYIKPMGAGAVAAAGLITLLKTLPTIFNALTAGIKTMRPGAALRKAKPHSHRERLSMGVVMIGSLLIVACMFLFLEFKPVPGAFVGWAANLAAALLVVVFGFLFVTVSSRIVGLVGSSASPVSGMTIATLMATAADVSGPGLDSPAFGALAITIGGVVCIAAVELRRHLAGPEDRLHHRRHAAPPADCADDRRRGLDRGDWLDAEPDEHRPAGVSRRSRKPWDLERGASRRRDASGCRKHLPAQIHVVGADAKLRPSTSKHEYIVLNAIGSSELQDGKYLYSPATGRIEVQWIQGIGSAERAALHRPS